jgi:RNA polymerase sigma factor for flagellar operon FliA
MTDAIVQPIDQRTIDTLVRDHYDVVRGVALQLRRQISPNLQLDDLVGFGHEGLLRAARTFEPARGVPFKAWAILRIRCAMFDGLRSTGALPRRLHQRMRAAAAANEVDTETFATEDASKANENQLDDYLTGVATAMALGYLSREHAETVGLIPPRAETPEEQVENQQLQGRLRAAVETLPDAERSMLTSVYFNHLTIEEAAEAMGLSKSWGSRLHARAVEILAKRMRIAV